MLPAAAQCVLPEHLLYKESSNGRAFRNYYMSKGIYPERGRIQSGVALCHQPVTGNLSRPGLFPVKHEIAGRLRDCSFKSMKTRRN